MSSQDQDGYGAEIARAKSFSLRAMEILFRHKILFLLPIIALTALGVVQASQVSATYQASAALSTATNPLLEDQQVRGITIERFETPAEGTSRIIDEQLRTDAFVEEIAERVGLGDALEAALIDLDMIRENVSTSAGGSSLLSVEATWGDAVTAYQLVNGVIDTYLEYLADTVASDSSEAVSFYEGIRDGALEDRAARQDELERYLNTLPAIESERDRPISVQLRIDELTGQIDDADERVAEAERRIDEADLSVLQSRSNAGRSVQVVDEPTVPTAPQAALPQRVVAVGGSFIIGMMIAVAALLFMTVLDRTVSAPEDLTSLPAISLVVLVPPDGRTRGRRRRGGKKSKGRTSKRGEPRQADAASYSGRVDDDVRPMEGAAR